MNKMGLCQRFWCLLVTIALLLAAGGIYPDFARKTVQASGSTADSKDSQNTHSTHNAAIYTSIHSGNTLISSNASSLGGISRSGRPAAEQAPQPALSPADRKKTSETSKPLASLPVAAPAPEQIITSMKVTATGYTAGYESTGKTSKHPQYGITYSGVKVRRDKNAVSTIAADPRVLPLGSILYIPGYGYAVVADTGSAIKGRKIDLYFATTKQVYKEWGKKTVVVQLIKRGNGKCTESMLKSLGKAIQTYKTVPQDLLEQII